MPFSRLRTRATQGQPASAALTADDVVRVYETAFGRSPSEQEIAHQLAHAPTLRILLEAVHGSEEARARRSAPAAAGAPVPEGPVYPPEARTTVNVFTDELEPFGIAAGTWSADGVAVTGRRGWVFLGAGSNAILDQYRNGGAVPEDFAARWTEAMAVRRSGAEKLGAAFVGLIVPDKLPVLASEFPDPLPGAADAPAAVPGGAYLRTDTHLTYEGNAALAAAIGAELGVAITHEVTPDRVHRHVGCGDLGSRFSPPIVEIVQQPMDFGDAALVDSNHEEINAVGGHVGTRQVLRNDGAADSRTVVVFGDSYAFAAPHYHGVAWFMAQAFREVHFVWAPFGWDPDYAAAVGAEVIVCEGAERFAIRPPQLQVDAYALAAQTVARLSGGTVAAGSEETAPEGEGEAPSSARVASPSRSPSSPSWRSRFPPPARPWTPDYADAHRALVSAAIDDPALRAAALDGALPDGYAAGFDERTIEYPWLFAQDLGGRVLDAGSTFNHRHILDRALPRVDDLTIMTLVPEGHDFAQDSVSYTFGDLRELPFRDGWFDMVVSLSTLEHVGMDNATYGAAGTSAPDPDAEVARAARELRRVTRSGGRILLSVPYGRREDHGWFRQFDAVDLEQLVAAFDARSHRVALFRHSPAGWQRCSADEAADLAYRDYNADPSPVADGAAAARAVACVALEL